MMLPLLESERVVTFADLAPQEKYAFQLAKKELGWAYHPDHEPGLDVAATVLVILPEGKNRYYPCSQYEVRPRDGVCAEEAAIILVHKAHHLRHAKAMYVIDQHGDGSPTEEVPYACGRSCGWISELARSTELGGDFPVVLANTELTKIVRTTLRILKIQQE